MDNNAFEERIGSQGFTALQELKNKRNNITHPQTQADLQINNHAEIFESVIWFNEFVK